MVVSKRKRGYRVGYKTRQVLGENGPETAPTPEDSRSTEWYSTGESIARGWWGEFFDRMDYSSDFDSRSGSESSVR